MAANRNRFTRAAAGDMSVPVGFRFRPTEEELIDYYLQMKLEGKDYRVSDVIREINICNHEPKDLPGLSLIKSDDQEWYFFSTYKKTSKNQTERATKEGFWKITGAQKLVKTQDKRTIIGKKKILTFYRGHVRNSQKTNWGMHEYYIPQTNPNANQRDFVLCCVRKKPGENVDAANCDEGESSTYNVDAANCDEGESSTYNKASDFEDQVLLALGMDIEEPQPSLDYFERENGHMLANAHGNQDFHELQSAFGANEQDENFAEFLNSVLVDGDQDETTHANIFNDSTRPQFNSSHSRRQEGVMLYQAQAASSVNVVPKPQIDRLQVVTDEHSGTHRRQLVNDEHSGTHQRTSRPQRESTHNGCSCRRNNVVHFNMVVVVGAIMLYVLVLYELWC